MKMGLAVHDANSFKAQKIPKSTQPKIAMDIAPGKNKEFSVFKVDLSKSNSSTLIANHMKKLKSLVNEIANFLPTFYFYYKFFVLCNGIS